MININKEKFIGIFIILLVLALFIFTNYKDSSLSGLLSIHMIDVGQGESILIITPNNKTILIDGGEQSAGRRVKAYLNKNRINKINLLITTHPHSDHIGGLTEVIQSFKVEKIIMPEKLHTSLSFEKLLTTIESKRISISNPPLNNIIQFDTDIKLHFLGPLKNYGDNLNLWSVVFKLDYIDKSFLFTGDIEIEAEMDLISTYSKEILNSNLLNVAHHGSSTSTSQQFLDLVHPEICLISAGKDNSYGHPNNDVIDRLKNINTFIYRTDFQGTVVILSDGTKIWSNIAPFNQKDSFQKLP